MHYQLICSHTLLLNSRARTKSQRFLVGYSILLKASSPILEQKKLIKWATREVWFTKLKKKIKIVH